MRAISSFSFEARISTRECLAAMALRIRVNISAMGSVMHYSIFDCQLPIADLKLEIGNRKSAMSLPACLHDAGNLSLQRQLAKSDAAQIELAHAKLRSSPLFRKQ